MFLPVFVGNTVLGKPFDCFRVLHALERSIWHREFGIELHNVFGNGWVRHCDLHNSTNYKFKVIEQILERNEVKFRLYMYVFCEMAARQGPFGAERFLNAPIDGKHVSR